MPALQATGIHFAPYNVARSTSSVPTSTCTSQTRRPLHYKAKHGNQHAPSEQGHQSTRTVNPEQGVAHSIHQYPHCRRLDYTSYQKTLHAVTAQYPPAPVLHKAGVQFITMPSNATSALLQSHAAGAPAQINRNINPVQRPHSVSTSTRNANSKHPLRRNASQSYQRPPATQGIQSARAASPERKGPPAVLISTHQHHPVSQLLASGIYIHLASHNLARSNRSVPTFTRTSQSRYPLHHKSEHCNRRAHAKHGKRSAAR